LAAAPIALQTHPDQRKVFDTSVINSVGAIFEKDAAAAVTTLAEGAPAESQASAEALGFWALADVLRDRAQAAAAERSAGEKAVRDAEEHHHSAQQRVASLESAQASRIAESAASEARQAEVAVALEAFDRLVTDNYAAAVPALAMNQPEGSVVDASMSAPYGSVDTDDVDMQDIDSESAQPLAHSDVTAKVEHSVPMDVDMRLLGA